MRREPADRGPAKAARRLTRFRLRLRRPAYWVALPLLSALIFVCGEAVVALLKDNDFRATQAVFALGLGLGPATLIYLAHTFESTLGGDGTDSLASVLWPPGGEGHAGEAFDTWRWRWQRYTFGLRTGKAKIMVLLITAAGVATLVYSGLPFHSPVLNVACLILFTALLLLCGRAAFTFLQLLRFLTDIGRRDVYAPFFRLPHPAISALLRYYSWLALMTVAGYVVLVVAVWTGPYGPSLLMLLWLSVLAAYPIAMVCWSVIQIHRLMQRAKQHHLDDASRLVAEALTGAQISGSLKRVGALREAMTVQERLQQVSDWPFSAASGTAFAASVATVLGQIWAFWIALPRPH